MPAKLLKGKSARIVVTMGMPALAYRWYFRAHSLKNLKRNMLGFCGIAPIRESLFGLVETVSQARREKWLDKMYKLGVQGR
jgi:putative NADPH-quinone reductase